MAYLDDLSLIQAILYDIYVKRNYYSNAKLINYSTTVTPAKTLVSRMNERDNDHKIRKLREISWRIPIT